MITLNLRRRPHAPLAAPVAVQPPSVQPQAVPANDAGLSAAVRRLSEEEAARRPRPSFTPRPPAATRPLEAVTGPAGEAAARDGDAEFRRRMTAGLTALGVVRGRDFLNDWHDLPHFRAAARTAGWCGMHSQPTPPHRRRSTERWMRNAMAEIERQFWQARSDADAQLGRMQAEVAMELDRYQRTGRKVIVSGD